MADISSEFAGKAKDLGVTLGRSGLNAMFPDDFEAYLLSLELVSITKIGTQELEETIRFFSFPVMPNSITYTEPQLVNVKKTMGGITTLSTDSFLVKDIQIQGNFGRNFRFITNALAISFNSLSTSFLNKKWGKETSNDDKVTTLEALSFAPAVIKNGYGSTVLLRKMIEKSKLSDDGIPRKLYLHIPALGKSYLVKPTNISLSQNMSNNMMWNYNISFKVLADLKIPAGRKVALLAAIAIQATLNKAAQVVANKYKTIKAS